MPILSSDVIGRVKRLALKPSAASALTPLFEAVSNALHAVQDRFGEEAKKLGEVEIEVLGIGSGPSIGTVNGFRISDNGVGLDDENYNSFLRPNSFFKEKRGGKGVGRLGWLRVFKQDPYRHTIWVLAALKGACSILSWRRMIKSKSRRTTRRSNQKTGTRVILINYNSVYGARCPARWQTLVEWVIGHFLSIFAANSAPWFLLSMVVSISIFDNILQSKLIVKADSNINVSMPDEQQIQLKLRNIKAHKVIRYDKSKYNWLYLTANDRAVEENAIDDALGLKLLDGEYVYLGCAFGRLSKRACKSGTKRVQLTRFGRSNCNSQGTCAWRP